MTDTTKLSPLVIGRSWIFGAVLLLELLSSILYTSSPDRTNAAYVFSLLLQIISIVLTAVSMTFFMIGRNPKYIGFMLVAALVLNISTSFIADYTFLQDTNSLYMFDVGFKAVAVLFLALLIFLSFSGVGGVQVAGRRNLLSQ